MVYDTIIIGKGPAGISAGLYLKRGNSNVLIIGKDGGALEKIERIDNYYGIANTISGKELLINGIEQAKRLGIEILTDEVVNVKFNEVYNVKTRNGTYISKTLILATGTNRKIPQIKGIIEFEGKGISYCAVCDGFFYRNKNVCVLGSGDYAIEEARTLLPIVKKVSILTNGEKIIENRDSDYTKFTINENEILQINGNKTVNSVQLKNGEIINTDGIFIAIGTASSVDLARKLGVIISENNIAVNENLETNVPGLFACGDCTGGLLQVSKAVYEGAISGINCIKYLRKINNI